MSEMALELIARAKRERWKRLDLGRTGIVGAVPEEVGELEDLEELILSNDESHNNISRAYFLYAGNNGMPNEITHLPSKLPTGLTVLLASRTMVVDINCLAKLKNLHTLDLSCSLVRDIAPIATLPSLRILCLNSTSVTNIEPLSYLSELCSIDLSWTHISLIDPLIDLKKLVELEINNTKVSDIESLKFKISSGLELTFHGCPITKPPSEIANEGLHAVLKYWKEQDRVGKIPAKEIKLLLLGNPTAGKSTLAHALIYGEFSQNHLSTYGGNLNQNWYFGDLKINIWDFGGQEYFHATHCLLMNDDALYIVACDPKFDGYGYHLTSVRYFDETKPTEEELEHFPHQYWLEMIREHAPRSRVLFVWTKMDVEGRVEMQLAREESAPFIPPASISQFQSGLQGALEAHQSPWTGNWQAFLQNLSVTMDKALEGKQVIQYWPSIRDAIEERSKTAIRISWEEFEALCKADDPLRELGLIVTYLRDMCGAILYFPDHPTLKKTVFINPNKINELIYAVLNRQVKDAGGQFTLEDAQERVRKVLELMHGTGMAASDAETFTKELIEVMKAFKIITEVAAGSENFIAPQYLPRDEPAGLEKEKRRAKLEPAFQIRFKTYIPRHIVPRFIAEKGLFAKDETWWKFGILYEETPSATALVQVDYSSRVLSVSIHDPERHRAELHAIFELLKQLIENDKALEVSLDGEVWVDFERLKEAGENRAPLVKTVDGMRVGIEPFRLFLSREGDFVAGSEVYDKFGSSLILEPEAQGLVSGGAGGSRFTLPHLLDAPESVTSTLMKHIYISYAKEDLSNLEELQKCLDIFHRTGEFSHWSRKMILPGERTIPKIESELERADVILLLISSNYTSARDEAKHELEMAIQRGEQGKSLIVPVVLSSVYGWQKLPIGIYPAARNGEPLDLAPNKDQAWSEIMEWITQIFESQTKWETSRSDAAPLVPARDVLIQIANSARNKAQHSLDKPALSPNSMKDVFVSYSTKDQAAKDEVCGFLEQAGISYFLDSNDLEFGKDLEESLKTSLRNSRCSLMIVSSNSLLSTWVGMETMFRLKEEYTRDQSRLICVVVDESVLDLDFPIKMQQEFKRKREGLEELRRQMKESGGSTEVYDVEIRRLERLNVSDIMLKVRNHLGLVLNGANASGVRKLISQILQIAGNKVAKEETVHLPTITELPKKSFQVEFTPFHRRILKDAGPKDRYPLEVLFFIAYHPEHRCLRNDFHDNIEMDGRMASLSVEALIKSGWIGSDKTEFWVLEGFRTIADQVIQELAVSIESGQEIEIHALLQELLGASNSVHVGYHVRKYLDSKVENGEIVYQTATRDKLVIQKKGDSKVVRAYNIKNIMNLLSKAFDPTDLERFSMAHFHEIFQEFTPSMAQQMRINLLVNKCRIHGKFDELLELVKSENPYQYAQCGPYLL